MGSVASRGTQMMKGGYLGVSKGTLRVLRTRTRASNEHLMQIDIERRSLKR